MARYTGPVCRMCRVEQKKLMLKGNRCKSDKCPINKKRPAPGKDPKGRSYYWIYEQRIEKDIEPDTDYHAVFAGDVSVTPLHLDPTHDESLNHLSHWAKTLAEAFRK